MNNNLDKPRLIGIIGAMKVETDDIKGRVEAPVCETFSGIDFVRGRLLGHEVVAAKCGVGKVFAAMCAQTMILKYAPDIIISMGVGGSLSPELNIGDIAIASELCQHDMDTSHVGDEVGMVSGVNMVYFPACGEAVRRFEVCAEGLGLHSVTGVIASGDVFVGDAQRKRFITDTFGALCCEMESAAIAQVCYVNDVPFAAIRAVSDNGDANCGRDYADALSRASSAATAMVYEFLK